MRDPRDDTIVIMALLLLRELLRYSNYPEPIQREISRRATAIIEHIQAGYPEPPAT